MTSMATTAAAPLARDEAGRLKEKDIKSGQSLARVPKAPVFASP